MSAVVRVAFLALAVALFAGATLACTSFSTDAGASDGGGEASLADAATPALEGGYVAAVLGDGPLAFWRLNEPTPGGAVFDSVAQRPLGSYHGAVFPETSGLLGDPENRALKLNGSGYFSVEPSPTFDFGGVAPFSLETWVKPVGNPAGASLQGIVTNNHGPDERGYSLHRLGGNVLFERQGASRSSVSGALSGVAFSHVVATFDGSEIALYINGARVAAPDRSSLERLRPTSLTVGGSHGGMDGLFFGAIDEVAIYGKALSPDRVSAHYRAGL